MRPSWRLLLAAIVGVGAVIVGVVSLRHSPPSSDRGQEAHSPSPIPVAPAQVPSEKPLVQQVDQHAPAHKPSDVEAPPPVSDKSLEPLVDKSLPLKERVFSNMSARYPTVAQADDYPSLCKVLCDTSEDDVVRHEVASLLQRSKYPGLAAVLCQVLDNPKEEARFHSFAAQHLGLLAAGEDSTQRGIAIEKLRPCLMDRDIPVRREALLALVRVNDPEAIRTAVAWLEADPNATPPGMDLRDLAIRCVQELDLRASIPTIRQCVRDPNEGVRIAAIVALSSWGDEESRPAIVEAARSPNARLQRCGKMALERLDRVRAQETKP